MLKWNNELEILTDEHRKENVKDSQRNQFVCRMLHEYLEVKKILQVNLQNLKEKSKLSKQTKEKKKKESKLKKILANKAKPILANLPNLLKQRVKEKEQEEVKKNALALNIIDFLKKKEIQKKEAQHMLFRLLEVDDSFLSSPFELFDFEHHQTSLFSMDQDFPQLSAFVSKIISSFRQVKPQDHENALKLSSFKIDMIQKKNDKNEWGAATEDKIVTLYKSMLTNLQLKYNSKRRNIQKDLQEVKILFSELNRLKKEENVSSLVNLASSYKSQLKRINSNIFSEKIESIGSQYLVSSQNHAFDLLRSRAGVHTLTKNEINVTNPESFENKNEEDLVKDDPEAIDLFYRGDLFSLFDYEKYKLEILKKIREQNGKGRLSTI